MNHIFIESSEISHLKQIFQESETRYTMMSYQHVNTSCLTSF